MLNTNPPRSTVEADFCAKKLQDAGGMGGLPAPDGSGEDASIPGRYFGREPNLVITTAPMPTIPTRNSGSQPMHGINPNAPTTNINRNVPRPAERTGAQL